MNIIGDYEGFYNWSAHYRDYEDYIELFEIPKDDNICEKFNLWDMSYIWGEEELLEKILKKIETNPDFQDFHKQDLTFFIEEVYENNRKWVEWS